MIRRVRQVGDWTCLLLLIGRLLTDQSVVVLPEVGAEVESALTVDQVLEWIRD